MITADITVCISTLNRYKHLKWLINYFFEYHGSEDILVLDSSSEDIKRICNAFRTILNV